MSPKRVGATENANRAPGGVQRRVGTKIRQASGTENALAKGSCGRFCKRLDRLKKRALRVIIGVSGHNVKEQINRALEPVPADGNVVGIGLWEMTLSRNEESSSDHAAEWETSNMMLFYPALIDMSRMGTAPLAPHMKPPDGIGGVDAREHASVAVGRRNVELAAEAVGQKARELTQPPPDDQRCSNAQSISPEHWWTI